jgi:hypothetical protein
VLRSLGHPHICTFLELERLFGTRPLKVPAKQPCCRLNSQLFKPRGKVHRLAVRASDELGNVDTTPAEYRWRVDLTRPRRPSTVLRLAGNRMRVALSARDRDDPARALKFLCALDRPKLYPCPASFTRMVRPGRHLLRARAVDPAGNTSAIALTRFSR